MLDGAKILQQEDRSQLAEVQQCRFVSLCREVQQHLQCQLGGIWPVVVFRKREFLELFDK